MLVDSHCHLDFPKLSERLPDVLAAAKAAGVGRMVTISTHVALAERYRALAEAHDAVFCTVGTHPHNAAEEPDVPAAEIVALARHPRCVAIGEAGLDYHYDNSPRDVQARVFRTHIAAARESGLPLVVHARDADDDMIRIFREEMGQGAFDAVLHCFSSGRRLAEIGVELGFYVSFSGIVTFKRSDELRGDRPRRSPRAAARRDRCALPRARAASRPSERAGLCGAHGAGARRRRRRRIRRVGGADDRELLPPVRQGRGG